MKIASQGHEHIMRIIQPGMYEYELSSEFYNFCADFDIEKWAYDPIVGSGRDSAILHYISKLFPKNNKRQ